MQSRWQAFWKGVRRGLKFGATVGLVIYLIMACVGVIGLLLIPEMRQEMLAELKGMSALQIVGNVLAPIALLVLYGAVPGAIIMGVASMLRTNRNASQHT